MSTKHKKTLTIVSTVIGVVVILILLAWITKYYPVAKVGGEYISALQIDQSYSLAKKLDAKVTKQQAIDQVIMINQKEQLLHDFKISMGNAVDEELEYYKTGKTTEYNKLLKDYFSGKEGLFVDYVVKPQVVDNLLRIKYNSDFNANNSEYTKAQGLLSRIEMGEKFEDLAKISSEDKISGQLGGDIGFVNKGQLLPELENVVEVSTMGEVKKQIVVSRLGYHILYPVEVSEKDGQKVWHIKHILIQTKGYEAWLSNQVKNVGVFKFVNI